MKIKIINLCKSYGKVTALKDINMELTPGIYGLLGPNGAGKSTLISLLTDNIKRESGEILCDGKDITGLGAEYRKRIGYMPQQQNMYSGYSAIAFLKYISAIKGIPAAAAARDIEGLLKAVNLWDVRQRRIETYSGGMKQRVLLAQALLGDPEMIILDEPTAGLDPNERINIRNYIARLASDKIILYATHVVSDIECIADNIIFLKKGKIIMSGKTTDVIHNVEGHIYTVKCTKDELEKYQKQYRISNIKMYAGGYMIRIVADTIPEYCNKTDEPGLEEAYLYYCC